MTFLLQNLKQIYNKFPTNEQINSQNGSQIPMNPFQRSKQSPNQLTKGISLIVQKIKIYQQLQILLQQKSFIISHSPQMLQNYISPYPKKNNSPLFNQYTQSNNESLLLSNNNRQKYNLRLDNEEYLVKLHDLIQTQNLQDKINQFSIIEEATIVKNGNRNKGQEIIKNCQISNKQESKNQIMRLKKILKNKNKIIGELSEQIKILTHFINKILLKNNNKNKKIELKQDRQLATTKGQLDKENDIAQWQINMNMRQEINFLNKNNSQLYQQLKKVKDVCEIQEIQLKTMRKSREEVDNKIGVLIAENEVLKRQNEVLVKKAQDYLKQDKRQIKIVNKIRQVLNEKTYHKIPHLQYKRVYEQMKQAQLLAKERNAKKILAASLSATLSATPNTKSKSEQKRKQQTKRYNQIRNLSQQLKIL